MMLDLLQTALAVAVTGPVVALVVLGGATFVTRQVPERHVHQLLAGSLSLSLVLATFVLLGILAGAASHVDVDFGTLVAVRGYHFDLRISADAYGAVFLWLDFLLCGIVGAFSAQYLHRDEGYHRFFLLMLVFVVGLELVATGSGLDVVFAGWELLGLSSALLIAFFIKRPAPVEHGLRAFAVYRTTDVALLLAIVTLHHHAGDATFVSLGALHGAAAATVGALVVVGAMGKGAIIPFTPWLPRAMEGPTTSSAIFYGALSVHASPFLLIRASDLFEHSVGVRVGIVVLGALTALHASTVGRTQTDIKTSLGYAAVTQVGVIWIEVGLGLLDLAMCHIVGHAILRTWQLLRAPSVLHDRQRLVVAIGRDLEPTGLHYLRILPVGVRRWAYRMALERWYLDELHEAAFALVARPLRAIDRLDRRWGALVEPAPDATATPSHVARPEVMSR